MNFFSINKDDEINNIISKNTENLNSIYYFKKSKDFFYAKQWDSTLVYAMKQLNEPCSIKIKDYSHYFRGVSFSNKKILNQSLLEFDLVTNNFYLNSHVLFFLGCINLDLNNYKKAIGYLKKIENLPKNKIHGFKPTKIIHNIGLCYLHLKQFNEAEKYLLKSEQLHTSDKDTLMLIGSYGDLATLYYDQYKDNLAISYFTKAYQLSKTTKDFLLKQNTALNMAVVEENRKDFKKAMLYRKEYEQWKDSLTNQNKIWEVAKLEKEFTVKQKQKEVSLLQAENKIKEAQKRGYFYSAMVLLLLLATAIYFFIEKVKTNKIITTQKENLNNLNATKDKLFSIVSHDLRSSVNALKSSNGKLLSNLEANNLKEVDTLLHNNSAIVNGAYSLLDNLLHWALLQTKQSYFDIAPLRLFVITEQIAYNYRAIMIDKNIDFTTHVIKKHVVQADQESIKLILRNLIDNAIKFTDEKGSIKIYSQQSIPNYYDLVVEDTGLGMNETTRLDLLKDDGKLSKKQNEDMVGTGLGLQLCKSMIAKNKGKLSIESELGKGTKMIVSLVMKG